MPVVPRRWFPAGRAAFVLSLLWAGLNSTHLLADDPVGLVWFIGSVTGMVDDQAAVDVGEIHDLRSGEVLAVFRPQDDHFTPLGTLAIEDSHPTWCLMAKSSRFEPREGDRVIYVRTLKQLGTAPDFRDKFLKHRHISKGHRNSYSSVGMSEQANTLQRFLQRQPQWVKEHKPVAGAIRGASIDRGALEEMQPLLNQILKCHEFQSLGVPVDAAVGADWALVLATLRIREGEDAESPADSSVKTAEDEPSGEPASALIKSTEIPIELIRRTVEQTLFIRTPEERRVATLLCTALEQFSPRHETLWISQQLRSTQFASLADDEQLLAEYETVMERVRAAQ